MLGVRGSGCLLPIRGPVQHMVLMDVLILSQ
ncbi:hypothetical protein SAMN05216562_0883 [Microbulbifer marinus]|uniref:Uncharacterized protein n=1 Tax=Microbulbifer marinus TaxID=658218 RepID=A0A1H3WIC9_9GAMM|nr:hypothetical protein SAMN05216562_0883 [Microbulbifer marinus]